MFFQLRHALKGPERVLPSIALVDLSDATIAKLGMKGGDRKDFAALVEVLTDAGAASVIFDIIFPVPGTPEGDAAFTRAVGASGRVYLPIIMTPAAVGKLSGQSPVADELPAGTLWHPRVLRAGDPPVATTDTLSYRALSGSAAGIGHINSEPDPDGTFRRMPLLFRYRDGYVPSIAFRAACDALRVDPGRIEVSFGSHIRLPDATLPDGSVRSIDIPVDRRGRMIVDFAGPWGASFTHYPFATLIASRDDPDLAEQVRTELEGGRLIVSDITVSGSDYGPVPFESVYPLSGLHANVLNSVLSDRFLRAPAWYGTVLLNLLFAALLWLVAWRLRPLASSLVALGIWVVFSAGQFALFATAGIMPSLAAPTLGFAFALVATNGYRFFQSEREKLLFRTRMERYFAPQLMSKILKAPDKLMTAEQKVITVLFSDIAGFTSWCTTQSPETIHRTLNEYFEIMTEIVFRNEGTVDKFIGDGLMAFFGDPLDQPDHSLRAVRSGIEMQQAVRGLRARWESEGRMPIHIRIGINSGEVVVGDMGSRRIMAYTAIGSHVNLGSRLESKAPIDGVLVSGRVHEAVKDAVETRFAGNITAKGISEEFATWEVIVP